MEPKLTLGGRLIALAFGIAVMLICGELVLRVTMPNWREFYSGWFMSWISVPDGGWVRTGKPNFNGYFSQNNGDFRVNISINDVGLRNPEPGSAADGQIWVIGDSMAFGWGVEQDEMYSEILQKELGRPVYNIASPGADLCGYQRLPKVLPPAVRPTAVVMGLIVENDIAVYDCAREENLDVPTSAERRDEALTVTSIPELKLWLTQKSALYNFFAVNLKRVDIVGEILTALHVIERPHQTNDALDASLTRAALDSSVKEILALKSQMGNSLPFVVVVAPTRSDLRGESNGALQFRIDIEREFCRVGIKYVDPFETFQRIGFDKVHFIHDGHWSKIGHQITGRALADIFRDGGTTSSPACTGERN